MAIGEFEILRESSKKKVHGEVWEFGKVWFDTERPVLWVKAQVAPTKSDEISRRTLVLFCVIWWIVHFSFGLLFFLWIFRRVPCQTPRQIYRIPGGRSIFVICPAEFK
jgi:hypothetical protein